MDFKGNKGARLLNIYERLNHGEHLVKAQLAKEYSVTEKTIQRDIDDLRAYLADVHFCESEAGIEYRKSENTYVLVGMEKSCLTNQEILILIKILLESRALQKDELSRIISALSAQTTDSDKKIIEELICSELFGYVPLRHGKKLIESVWRLTQHILQNEIIEFNYTRKDGTFKAHTVKPVAVMFSEFYFYLIAFMADGTKEYPTVFRIDRIEDIRGTKEHFLIPYKDRFNDGEFKKRVQFMYSGELKRVKFEYSGQNVDSILDRLPTAEIINEKDNVYTIRAESYGDGIYMYLRSQGENVRILE